MNILRAGRFELRDGSTFELTPAALGAIAFAALKSPVPVFSIHGAQITTVTRLDIVDGMLVAPALELCGRAGMIAQAEIQLTPDPERRVILRKIQLLPRPIPSLELRDQPELCERGALLPAEPDSPTIVVK
jgi:hypothetical protein